MYIEEMKIFKDLYSEILSYYPAGPPEQGGIIGMQSGVVCKYVHDETSKHGDNAYYEPNTTVLNEVIAEWYANGIFLAGIVHSHPDGHDTLSHGDLHYAKLLFDCNPTVSSLYFPLICRKSMIPYRIEKRNEKLSVIRDATEIINY